jgi:toxin ParE1/3/4
VRQVRLSPRAAGDLVDVLQWSLDAFGTLAAQRYEQLLYRALADLAADPHRAGVKSREDLRSGLYSYHLYYSRRRGRGNVLVSRPRHAVFFTVRPDLIDVIRILHDAMDRGGNLPSD